MNYVGFTVVAILTLVWTGLAGEGSPALAQADSPASGVVWRLEQVILDPPQQTWSQTNADQTQGSEVQFGAGGKVLREFRKRRARDAEYSANWTFTFELRSLPEVLRGGETLTLDVHGLARGFPADADLLAELGVRASGVTLDGRTSLRLNTSSQLEDSIGPKITVPQSGTFFSITTFLVNRPSNVTRVYRRVDSEPPNRAPGVELTWTPRFPNEGETLTFSARGRDQERSPLRFEWTYGENRRLEDEGAPAGDGSEVSSMQWSDPPTGDPLLVTVDVIDQEGSRGRAEAFVAVRPEVASIEGNRPPSIGLTWEPAKPDDRTPLELRASATDPDGDPVTFMWFYGGSDRGRRETGESTDDGAVVSKAEWAEPAAGSHTVTVYAFDGRGGIAQAEKRIEVEARTEVSGPPVLEPTRPVTISPADPQEVEIVAEIEQARASRAAADPAAESAAEQATEAVAAEIVAEIEASHARPGPSPEEIAAAAASEAEAQALLDEVAAEDDSAAEERRRASEAEAQALLDEVAAARATEQAASDDETETQDIAEDQPSPVDPQAQERRRAQEAAEEEILAEIAASRAARQLDEPGLQDVGPESEDQAPEPAPPPADGPATELTAEELIGALESVTAAGELPVPVDLSPLVLADEPAPTDQQIAALPADDESKVPDLASDLAPVSADSPASEPPASETASETHVAAEPELEIPAPVDSPAQGEPTPEPTTEPTTEPTREPTPGPTPVPTPEPTPVPEPKPLAPLELTEPERVGDTGSDPTDPSSGKTPEAKSTPETADPALSIAAPTPAPTATPTPTPTPTPRPTATPTPRPTATPTPRPTATATPRPTATATPRPTATATPRPTATPTPRPTATPTPRPTATPTPRPTATPTPRPTATATPTPRPTATPTPKPTPQLIEIETEEQAAEFTRERVVASVPRDTPAPSPSRTGRDRPVIPPMPEDEPLPVATPRPTVTPLPRVGEERTARDIAAVRPGPTRTPAPAGPGIVPRPAPIPESTPRPGQGTPSREVDITVLDLGVGTVVETATQQEIGRTELLGDTYAVSAYAGWPSHYRISAEPSSRMTATVKAQIRGGDSQRPIVGLILSIDPNDPQAPGSVFFGKDERRVIIDYKHGQNWQKLLDIWVPSDAATLDEFTLRKDNEVIRFILNGRELATWNAPTAMPMSAWLWTWEDTIGGFQDWRVTKAEETRARAASPAPAGKTWLGMALESVSGSAYGLRVTGLTPGSPTERAGLRPGDFLIDIDERRIDNFAVLEGIIAGAQPGRPLNVTIVREGRVYLVQVMPDVP